jgi:protein-S-isoprenylcysteine O-methyltransferase Ste14
VNLDHRIPPPVVGAIVAALMWGAAALAPTLGPPSPWRLAACGVLVAAGLAFDLAGLVAFRAARTTINPLTPQRSATLVTAGVYRITRNPMYVGLALLLSAWATWLGSLPAWLGPVAFVAYIDRFQIRPEERALQRLFGDAFSTYCARVRRWL